MNYPNLQAEMIGAELRGEARGILIGRKQIEFVNKRDLDDAWDRGHTWGLFIGSIAGAFLLAAGVLTLALVFL